MAVQGVELAVGRHGGGEGPPELHRVEAGGRRGRRARERGSSVNRDGQVDVVPRAIFHDGILYAVCTAVKLPGTGGSLKVDDLTAAALRRIQAPVDSRITRRPGWRITPELRRPVEGREQVLTAVAPSCSRFEVHSGQRRPAVGGEDLPVVVADQGHVVRDGRPRSAGSRARPWRSGRCRRRSRRCPGRAVTARVAACRPQRCDQSPYSGSPPPAGGRASPARRAAAVTRSRAAR